MPPQITEARIPGMSAGDAAWLARDQNKFIRAAMRKLAHLKDAFETDSDTYGDLLDLEQVLENMERVNHATLRAFQAAQGE